MIETKYVVQPNKKDDHKKKKKKKIIIIKQKERDLRTVER